MISVLILTKNEQQDLPGCLHSVAWSDDIYVFDSLSSDRTVEIANEFGARVAQRPFDDYASQRNAAIHGLTFKHRWVLVLDADERMTPELTAEMLEFVAASPAGVSACRMRRRDFLYGSWLKHAQISPYYLRLVRPDKVRYEREVNEILKVDGSIFDLKQPFDHYPFSKGMSHWLEKHNRYSSLEAVQVMKARGGETRFSVWEAFFNRDFHERRYHQKELFFRLPFRPFVKFLLVYFVKLGILDGRAGFTYAVLQAIYEYMIVLKTRELKMAEDVRSGRHDRVARGVSASQRQS
jgi:glycosyltransferase involved in cell wall biosynthesis